MPAETCWLLVPFPQHLLKPENVPVKPRSLAVKTAPPPRLLSSPLLSCRPSRAPTEGRAQAGEAAGCWPCSAGLRPAVPLGTREGRPGLVGSAFGPPQYKTILEQSGVNLSVEASTPASPGEKMGGCGKRCAMVSNKSHRLVVECCLGMKPEREQNVLHY